MSLVEYDDEPGLPPPKPPFALLPPVDAEPEPVRLGRAALSRPLGEFWQWEWVIECVGTCAYQRRPVAPLVICLPATITMGETIKRFRCKCGAGPQTVGMTKPNPVTIAEYMLLMNVSGGTRWRTGAGA